MQRLIVTQGAADDLDLPRRNEPRHAVEIVGMASVEPFGERAARVQAEPHAGMPLEQFEQWQVAVLIGLLDDVVEVADGLMIVEDEDEADGG